MVFRRNNYTNFFLYLIVGVLLLIISFIFDFHLFYIHYYLFFVSFLYLIASFFKFIIVNDLCVQFFYGVFSNHVIELEWDDIENVIFTNCEFKIRSSRGGRISIPLIETKKTSCIRFQLNKDRKRILDKSFYELPQHLQTNKNDKTISIFISEKPGSDLIREIRKFKEVKIEMEIQNNRNRIELIKKVLSLCFLSMVVIGILSLFFFN